MRISMPRGDIKWIRFLVNVPGGTSTDIDFTNIYFTVKKNSNDRIFLFQKSYKRNEIYKLGPGDYQLKINPEDTNKLSVGNYKFDIQISYKNILKESFVGDFVLKEEITYYENEDEEEEEVAYDFPQTSQDSAVVLVVPDYHLLELSLPVSPTVTGEDYNRLVNLPTFNGTPIAGNLTLEDFGLGNVGTEPLSEQDLEALLEP